MVKCKDCGYLAVRNAYGPETHEATEEVRDTGHARDRVNGVYTPKILCWKHDDKFKPVKIRGGLSDRGSSGDRKEIIESINRDIKCNSFRDWIPGKSPEVMENMINQETCLLYTSPSPRDATLSRMPSSA